MEFIRQGHWVEFRWFSGLSWVYLFWGSGLLSGFEAVVVFLYGSMLAIVFAVFLTALVPVEVFLISLMGRVI